MFPTCQEIRMLAGWQPELIYKHKTGAALFLTDWSSNDLLCFWTGESKSLHVLPLKGDRKPSISS